MYTFSGRRYPAKILLFGEYTVLYGGAALAVPYHCYGGHWSEDKASHPPLLPFFDHLSLLGDKLHAKFDWSLIKKIRDADLRFESSIPRGQGLGSSAALTAAAYDLAETVPELLEQQKTDLAHIEGFFHGESSGVDALVSYRDKPIYRDSEGLKEIELPTERPLSAYLWQTGKARSTQPLVAWFSSAVGNRKFRLQVEDLGQYSSRAVAHLLQGKLSITDIRRIGAIQWNVMSDLIPTTTRSVWQEVMGEQQMAIKLCGAGGGGCVLLFSTGPDMMERFPSLNLERIW